MMHTVLVIGGYGFFGQRICASLARDAEIHLLIGGRRREQAVATANALGLKPEQGIAVDAGGSRLTDMLEELKVDTLIHTAGPFQGQDYRVAKAGIAAGCNYIDLADGRNFVCDITALDAAAKARSVSVISGASSLSALSSAAIARYLPLFSRLDAIRIGIGSGAKAPGLATVKGVFGYCGNPITRLEQGRWTTTYGWQDLQRYIFPQPVGARWLGSCDVPDLTLFPQRYPTVNTVTFHAGFASALGHFVVWGLSWLPRIGLMKNLASCAAPLNRISRWMEPWVSDKGGMFVLLEGVGHDGQALKKTWHLLAAQNHGPYIPCGGSLALVKKLVARKSAAEKSASDPPAVPVVPYGAMPCVGLLSVEEYLAPLRDLAIQEVAE